MHVAHIIDQVDGIGGVQTYLADLIPALGERGVDSTLLVGRGDETTTFAGAPVIRAPETQLDGATLPSEAREALKRKLTAVTADVCLVHVAPSPDVARTAAEHMPTIVFAHDYFPACPGYARYLHTAQRFCSEGPGLRCFSRAYTERCTNRRPDRLVRAYRRERAWPGGWNAVARIVVASSFVRDVLADAGAPDERLDVIPYFVSPTPVPETKDACHVLFLGRLVALKGVDVLVRALADLPFVTAVIGGDGPHRPLLEQLSAELGLLDRVRFVGRVNGERRAELLAGAGVLALPSRWAEPFGIVGLEALAAGVPVVASRVGGIASWLDDGDAGLLVPPGDSTALAGALAQILNDPPRRAAMAEAARRSAERFSLSAHVDRLIESFDRALQLRPRTP